MNTFYLIKTFHTDPKLVSYVHSNSGVYPGLGKIPTLFLDEDAAQQAANEYEEITRNFKKTPPALQIVAVEIA